MSQPNQWHWRFLFVVLCFVSVFGWPAVAAAETKSYTIDQVKISGEVLPDGSLAVTETRRYDFDGDYRFAYRDIPLNPVFEKSLGRTTPYQISQVQVCD